MVYKNHVVPAYIQLRYFIILSGLLRLQVTCKAKAEESIRIQAQKGSVECHGEPFALFTHARTHFPLAQYRHT